MTNDQLLKAGRAALPLDTEVSDREILLIASAVVRDYNAELVSSLKTALEDQNTDVTFTPHEQPDGHDYFSSPL